MSQRKMKLRLMQRYHINRMPKDVASVLSEVMRRAKNHLRRLWIRKTISSKFVSSKMIPLQPHRHRKHRCVWEMVKLNNFVFLWFWSLTHIHLDFFVRIFICSGSACRDKIASTAVETTGKISDGRVVSSSTIEQQHTGQYESSDWIPQCQRFEVAQKCQIPESLQIEMHLRTHR